MAGGLRERLARAASRLPWADLGAAAGVSVVGLSQIFFALILENADYFPKEFWFHAGILVWAGLVPFALLAALDLGAIRAFGRGRAFAAWRAILYTGLFASALRQAQVFHPAVFFRIEERIPLRPLAAALLALVFLLCLRSREKAHRFVASLGILGVLLAGLYAGRTLFGAGGPGGAPPPGPGAPMAAKDPVILLIFDELGQDALLKDGAVDREGFPNFAAFAEDSARFTDAISNFCFTNESVPSMLSGRFNPAMDTPKLFDHLPADWGVVARSHYPPSYGWMRRRPRSGQVFLLWGRPDAALAHFFEIPAELADLFRQTPFSRSPFGVPSGRRVMPPLLRGELPPDRSVLADVEGFLASLDARDIERKLLLWHCPLPHAPFIFNPDGTTHGSVSRDFLSGPGSPMWRESEPGYDPAEAFQNYLKQVRFTDRVFGRVIERLKERGLYERSTIIVTSDHGLRSFGAVGPREWPAVIPGAAVRVPLMIRGPGVRPGLYRAEYQHVDFLPTLLDALGIPYSPSLFEGVSGFAAERPARTRVLLDSSMRPYAYEAAADRWRFIRASGSAR